MASPFLRYALFLASLVLVASPGLLTGQTPREAVSSDTHSAVEHFYAIGPAPDWVEPLTPDLDPPIPFEGPINPGIYFRLVDYQSHAEKGAEYYHYACEFLSVAGVHEESEFSIEFDPAYQTLELHRIRRMRDGEWEDVLDPEIIRLTVPEDELGEGLLDGHVSLLIFLKDVRPGDIVEYDYTLAGRNPVFEGAFFDTFPTEWETTVQQLSYRLLKDPERSLNWKAHRSSIEPVKRPPSDESEWEEWTWTKTDIPPRILENRLPAWFLRFGLVEISEFPDWQSVAAWGARQYEIGGEAVTPELAEVIDQIKADYDSTEDQIIGAIRFVQDSIRYLGIEDGANAFRPVQPNQSFERRFGDCKDKTVLLRQILAELGVDSVPVCVHHAWRERLDDLIPSPIAFDHVILRIDLPNGEALWCDATDSHQGGTVETLAFPRYGRGLVLAPETTGLSELPEPNPSDHRIEVVETYFLGDPGQPARLEVETIYTGAEADTARYHLESSEPDSLRRLYLDYYRENYPSIEIDGPIEPQDDREANRVVVREKYHFPDFWEPDTTDPGWYSKTLYLQAIRDLLAQPDHPRREMPYGLTHPNCSRHEIRMHLPGTDDDWAGYFDEERFLVESEAGIFERWATYDAEEVYATMVATYESTSDAVSPDGIEEFDESVNSIYELTAFDLWEVDDEEEAAAMAASDSDTSDFAEEFFAEDDSDPTTAILIGIGGLVIGVMGAGFGSLLTFLVMQARRPARTSAAHPVSGGTSGDRSGPPPLPPSARS